MKTFDDCIIFLLAKAYQKAHGEFKKRLQPYGLTPIQYLILETLWAEDGHSAGDIGKLLVLDGATVSGVLDRLVAGGWVVKKTDSEDKRVVRIFLSARGRDLKAELSKERNQVNDDLLQTFTLEESVLLKRLLRDFQK